MPIYKLITAGQVGTLSKVASIHRGSNKIAKVYRGTNLVYQSYVYNPLKELIERTITSLTPDMISNITTIGTLSFTECLNLNHVHIPNNINKINLGAFSACPNLIEITIDATTPPTLDYASAFSDTITTIYVPAASVEAYKTASVWKDLLTRENPVTFIGI